ncbi:hypothetical protein AUTU_26730 [Aureibacter tunicatorum]|nr:hypothetical protein AUTU_26730 [Aureibacter tunicatorum]
MILSRLNYKKLEFEELDTEKHDYVRIEIGISLNHIREKIVKFLSDNYCKNDQVKRVQNAYKKAYWWDYYINGISVDEYMQKHGASDFQIELFFRFMASLNGGVEKEDSFFKLAFQWQRAINIYLMTLFHKFIFIDTCGFPAMILDLTDLIIKSFIQRGGACIEVAYPHYYPNSYSQELALNISKKAKVIKIGEMKIVS